MYCNVCNKYKKCKKTKISFIFKKTVSFSIAYIRVVMNMKKYLKKQNQLQY